MGKTYFPFLRGSPHYEENFSRIYERDDALFYSKERLVPHLDSLALETIVDLIENLVIEDDPIILDLAEDFLQETGSFHPTEFFVTKGRPQPGDDNCPYYVRGWNHVYGTTSRIASYRLMYNREKDICSPIPLPSPKALRESIID